jgi:molecular chaperone GrpE
MAPEDAGTEQIEQTEGAPAEPLAPSTPSGDPEAPVTPPSEHPEESGLPDPEPEQPQQPEPTDHEAKAQEYLALAQRTKADFENFRKRAARDAALAQERGVAKLAKELLPAVDNLERALAHTPQSAEPEVAGFVAGVEHLRTDLVGALARAGIEQYSPEGQPFDPTHHEAVAQQPIEGAESGTVVEVYQRGYRLGELVLRPARVLVAA